MPNTCEKMAYFSHQSNKHSAHLNFLFPRQQTQKMKYFLLLRRRKLMQRSTHSKYSLNQINVQKTLRDFAETFKNQIYASYIHTFFSSTETYLNEYSFNYSTVFKFVVYICLESVYLNVSVSFDHMLQRKKIATIERQKRRQHSEISLYLLFCN